MMRGVVNREGQMNGLIKTDVIRQTTISTFMRLQPHTQNCRDCGNPSIAHLSRLVQFVFDG